MTKSNINFGSRPHLSRRRFLAIAAGVAALPGLVQVGAQAGFPLTGQDLIRWRGVALGAEASITLAHPDPAEGRELIARCLDEIIRLERVFSLYRPDSALSQLNRTGVLLAPPLDLVRLLAEAQRFSQLSGGAFDVTVQPLWALYADHFSRADADPAGPSVEAIERTRALVDWKAVKVSPDRVTLERPGMAITLNGIAQGYITDRVGDLLRANGLNHVLLDLGETLALGPDLDGRPWRVGIADPAAPKHQTLETLDLDGKALATSGGYGTRFDAAGRFHHLFDPASGRSPHYLASVTVVAASATVADALSTTLAVLPLAAGATLAQSLAGVGPVIRVRT
ncbi:FAD:protein FMN transferase [uncultured Gammaproteobacteria bacterium]